ncbi:MAG: tRNA (adenosine(37)-N6)-threonylcarbamoyltransferase complex transferase subunit TsaD [Bradymonadales bacterium]|nr:tRNA (adenosine(37)-N6)-threonylcarbamoyltransferase complex transferase subunit TsaD [Bradymonadales bacterium]
MLTLGIETSCDETAASVVEDGSRIRSSVIHSQIPIHARYGGVVPELASRNHIMAILPVLQKTLEESGVSLSDLDLVAVTRGPGLVGSLLVGLETAKMLAYIHNLPLVGVNHIEGHLLSPFVDPDCAKRLDFPYVALVVSGGHTALIQVHQVGKYTLLGRTLDDAAGEAFDKVAKRLGAPYPGGPYIEQCGQGGDPGRYHLPIPMAGKGLDFSFSGLKTAAALLIGRLEADQSDRGWLSDLCAAVQRAVVESLVSKAMSAVAQVAATRLVVAGGVACNSGLRAAILRECGQKGIEVFIPRRDLCTDNGAMTACAGTFAFRRNPESGFTQFSMDVEAAFPLGDTR